MQTDPRFVNRRFKTTPRRSHRTTPGCLCPQCRAARWRHRRDADPEISPTAWRFVPTTPDDEFAE